MSAFLRGAWLTLITRVTSMALGIASSVIVARALGPEGKGEYALVVLIAVLLQTTGSMGLDQAASYQVARGKEHARRLAATLALASGALGIALCGLHWVLTQIPWYIHYLATAGVEPALVWIVVAILPATLAGQSLTASLLGLERYGVYNAASLTTPLTSLLLLLVFVPGMDLGVAGAVGAVAGASVVTLLVALLLVMRSAPPAPTGSRSPGFGEAFSFGWRAHIANLAWFLHYRLDMFLVGYMVGPVGLGFYSTAVGLVEKLYMVPSVIGTLVFPRVAADSREREGTGNDPVSVTPRAARQSLWLTLAMSVGLAAVAYPLIWALYGSDFLPSVIPLWILLPGVVSLSLGRVLSADLNGRGKPGVVARMNGGMAVLNLALNLWWIPLWGIEGAALATSVSYTAAVILLGFAYRRESGESWGAILAFGGADLDDLFRALRALRHDQEEEPE